MKTLTSSRQRTHTFRVDWFFVLAFATFGIRWVPFFTIGGTVIEVWQVGYLALIGRMFASPRQISAAIQIVRKYYLFPTVFFFWLAYLMLRSALDLDPSGIKVLTKQFYLALGGLAVAASIPNFLSIRKTLFWTTVLSFAAFFITFYVSSIIAGNELFSLFGKFLASGNFKEFTFQGLKPIYNAYVQSDDPLYASALKNTLSSFLLLTAIMSISLASYGGGMSRMLVVGIFFTASAMLMLFLTRSVVAALLMSAFAASTIDRLIQRRPPPIMPALAGTVIVMILYLVNQTYFDALFIRVFEDTSSYEARLDQYSEALELAGEGVLIGHGFHLGSSGHPYHSLFISSLAYGGLIGLVLALGFYLALITIWIRVGMSFLSQGNSVIDGLNIAWIWTLPIMPVFRANLAGGGGYFDALGWPAIGITLGVFYALRSREHFVGVGSSSGKT